MTIETKANGSQFRKWAPAARSLFKADRTKISGGCMVNKPKPGNDNVLVQCGAQECTPCSSCDGPQPFTALAGLPRLHVPVRHQG